MRLQIQIFYGYKIGFSTRPLLPLPTSNYNCSSKKRLLKSKLLWPKPNHSKSESQKNNKTSKCLFCLQYFLVLQKSEMGFNRLNHVVLPIYTYQQDENYVCCLPSLLPILSILGNFSPLHQKEVQNFDSVLTTSFWFQLKYFRNTKSKPKLNQKAFSLQTNHSFDLGTTSVTR